MKKCPYCAEDIQDSAVKCRYCGEFLDGSGPAATPPVPSPEETSANPLGVGVALLGIFGVAGGLSMDVSVNGVNNIGLLADRSTVIGLGALGIVVGLVLHFGLRRVPVAKRRTLTNEQAIAEAAKETRDNTIGFVIVGVLLLGILAACFIHG